MILSLVRDLHLVRVCYGSIHMTFVSIYIYLYGIIKYYHTHEDR